MSRVFEHPNMIDFCCPLCGTDEDKPVILVPIAGTESGRNCEAAQVHHQCLLDSITYYRDIDTFLCLGIKRRRG